MRRRDFILRAGAAVLAGTAASTRAQEAGEDFAATGLPDYSGKLALSGIGRKAGFVPEGLLAALPAEVHRARDIMMAAPTR